MATIAECATHIDVGERRFQELLSAGTIDREKGRGNYDLDSVRNQYIRHLRAIASQVVRIDDERSRDKARFDRARAEKAEIELAAIRREFVPLDEVMSVITDAVSNTKARLRSVPTQAAPLINPESPARAERIVRDLIDTALAELSGVTVLSKRKPTKKGRSR